MISRRSLLRGLSVAVAAPAIVRAASLMPVKAWLDDPLRLNGIDLVFDESMNNWWIPQHIIVGSVSRARMIEAINRVCNEPPQIYAVSPAYMALLRA